MTKQLYNISLVSWTNGIIMIGIFVLVVVGLVVAVLMLMNSDKPKK
jgi:multisubunit Na+/H+ antiporter MnhB subunit